jgi:hypothetical protein
MGGQANTNSTAGASNFDGSIQSTVRASQSAGFSIISYTGNGTAGSTIGHGLNAVPEFVICKRRDSAEDWWVGHVSPGWAQGAYLQAPDAFASLSGFWNSTAPTSSAITLGTYPNTNTGTYICYAFASVAGYSLVSSYQANGSDDGTFVYCGFRPKFIIIKGADYSTDWLMVDASRDPDNPATEPLFPNRSYYEGQASTSFKVDILSNGFKLRHGDSNAEGYNYITNPTHMFYAIAENPFQANGGLAR